MTSCIHQSRLAMSQACWQIAMVGVVGCVATALSAAAYAQVAPTHNLLRANMPSGAIGRELVRHRRSLQGYVQPVKLIGPPGLRIASAAGGSFHELEAAPITLGFLVGEVYRLRVTSIPGYEDAEVFPTIELIDRLHPPLGKEVKYPIPIELTREELAMALDGRHVTRVIYLEPPETALPVRGDQVPQRYFEVSHDEDPLRVADELGRPVAILRMGSRVPGPMGPDATFLFGSPHVTFYDVNGAVPKRSTLSIEPGITVQGNDGLVHTQDALSP